MNSQRKRILEVLEFSSVMIFLISNVMNLTLWLPGPKGATGSPGSRTQGLDTFLSNPWASDMPLLRCKPHGSYRNVKPMGVRHAPFTLSTTWVTQECPTHGLPGAIIKGVICMGHTNRQTHGHLDACCSLRQLQGLYYNVHRMGVQSLQWLESRLKI